SRSDDRAIMCGDPTLRQGARDASRHGEPPRVSAVRDLRELVAKLEKHGRLRRIAAPVSADLEIAEITDRVSKGPAAENVALLFERVQGSDIPLLINAFGSADRMAWALGVDSLDELGERMTKLLDLRMPGPFAERL